MQEPGLKALELFLIEQLESNYALYEEHFQSYVTQILQDNLPQEMLAASNNADAEDKLNQVLSSIGLDMNRVLYAARANKAKELVHEYVQAEREAVTLVNELLTDAGASMDTFMSKALRDKIDDIERIHRLTAITESRRNAALREIDRHRAVLGQTLRQSVQQIGDDDFGNGELVLKLPAAQGKNAA